MEVFQMTVLIIAIIILIIVFSGIGIALKYSTTENIYPPLANTCPEYWSVDKNDNCMIPATGTVNAGKLYTQDGSIYLTSDVSDTSGKIYTPGYDSANGIVNFSDAGWASKGNTTICSQKSWASKNGIEWDGVSNYNACK